MSKWYAIMGLTKSMLKDWEEDMRKDIIIWEKDGMIQARIELNPIEALWMKFQIRKNNEQKGNHYYFKLVAIKDQNGNSSRSSLFSHLKQVFL